MGPSSTEASTNTEVALGGLLRARLCDSRLDVLIHRRIGVERVRRVSDLSPLEPRSKGEHRVASRDVMLLDTAVQLACAEAFAVMNATAFDNTEPLLSLVSSAPKVLWCPQAAGAVENTTTRATDADAVRDNTVDET